MKNPQKERNTPEAETIQAAAKSLEGKGERELFDALKGATAQQRAEGRLDDAGMDEVARTLSPMLSPAQRQKMERILAQLRG